MIEAERDHYQYTVAQYTVNVDIHRVRKKLPPKHVKITL